MTQHHTEAKNCAACHAGGDVAAPHTPPALAHENCDACHTPARIALLTPSRPFCLTCHQPAGRPLPEPGVHDVPSGRDARRMAVATDWWEGRVSRPGLAACAMRSLALLPGDRGRAGVQPPPHRRHPGRELPRLHCRQHSRQTAWSAPATAAWRPRPATPCRAPPACPTATTGFPAPSTPRRPRWRRLR